jgi:hypothetical protein
VLVPFACRHFDARLAQSASLVQSRGSERQIEAELSDQCRCDYKLGASEASPLDLLCLFLLVVFECLRGCAGDIGSDVVRAIREPIHESPIRRSAREKPVFRRAKSVIDSRY